MSGDRLGSTARARRYCADSVLHRSEMHGNGRHMYRWNNTLHLDAPRDRVWATLIDFVNTHTWNKKAGPATIETEGSMGQGTRVRMQTGSGTTVLTIEEWQPPRLLRLYLSRGRTTGSSRYHLTLDPKGGTQLEHTLELDPPLWLEPLMWFAGSGVKRELQALKRFVESKST